MDVGRLYSDPVVGLGRAAKHDPIKTIVTRFAKGGVKFGRALVKGTNDNDARVPAANTDKFIGIAAHSVEASSLKNEAYADGDVLAMAERGTFQVYVEEAVSPGDPVRIRYVADTGKFPGDFATTEDGGKTALLIGAEFISETTAAGIATIKLSGNFTTIAD